MDDTDASALVDAALQHDDEAARALVRKLYPLVAKIVRAHRPHRTDEEDLCQMIFIKVFQKLSQFSGKVPLEHWVSRIAVNTCLNQIQWEKIRPELRHADWLNIFSPRSNPSNGWPLICYICRDVRLKRSVNSPAGAQRSLKYGRFGRDKK